MNRLLMKTRTVTVLSSCVALIGILAISCSDKKKEEAAQLEAQMKQDQLAAESLRAVRVADSIAAADMYRALA